LQLLDRKDKQAVFSSFWLPDKEHGLLPAHWRQLFLDRKDKQAVFSTRLPWKTSGPGMAAPLK